MNHVVFLHGFTGAPASWDAVRDLTRQSYQALCPYLTGHGPALPGPSDDPTKASFTNEVDRLVRICHQDRHFESSETRVLCGYSLGARLALGMLVRHPSLFTQAILIGVHPGLSSDTERLARRQQDDELVAILAAQGLDGFLAHWQQLPLFATQVRLPATTLDAQLRIRKHHTAAGLAHSLRACGLAQMPSYLPHLSRLSARVTLLVGSEDHKFVKLAQDMHHALPHAQLEIVPNCGHNVALEAPAAVATLLDQALT